MATMNCEKCSKNKATFHLTSIENGKKRESHMCEDCARNSGMGVNFGAGPDLFSTPGPKAEKVKKNAKDQKSCPECGMTIEKIKEKMRLGCGEDYSVFSEELEDLLRKIHGSAVHAGKTPGDVDKEVREKVDKAKKDAVIARFDVDMLKLRKSLDEAVKSEKYEEAAKLRDQIRQLEKDKHNAVMGELASEAQKHGLGY